MAYNYADARFDDLDLDARVDRQKQKISVELFRHIFVVVMKQIIRIELARTVVLFLIYFFYFIFYLTLTLKTFI